MKKTGERTLKKDIITGMYNKQKGIRESAFVWQLGWTIPKR